MVLKCKSKINKSTLGHTQYLTIPAAIVKDSQYPFEEGDRVIIIIDVKSQRLVVEKLED